MEFSPVFTMILEDCGDEEFCGSTKIDFSEAVDPTTYGKLKRGTDISSNHCKFNNKYNACARKSFQVLLVQQRILAFLLACTKTILHDTTDDVLLSCTIRAAPPIVQILVKTMRNMHHLLMY
jgi:hypothetical protein